MKYIQLLMRMIVGGVLIYAGFLKAAGPSAEFAAAIAAYKILPSALVIPLSIALPYIEMWVGLFVFSGFYTRYAAITAAVMFAVFLIVLGSAQIRGIDLASCGCFGADALSPHRTFAMDTVLLALSLLTYRFNKFPQPYSLDQTLL